MKFSLPLNNTVRRWLLFKYSHVIRRQHLLKVLPLIVNVCTSIASAATNARANPDIILLIKIQEMAMPALIYILATPVLRAASATAAATPFPTRGSNAAGIIYSGLSSSSVMSPAKA